MQRPTSPCHHCSDRVVGCHGKCEKYIAFRKEREEYLKFVHEQKNFLDADALLIKGAIRMRKRQKGNRK